MKPLVSVRIPSYNHEKYIHACIESILNQTFQDFEIVIVDDCSTDGSVNIIRAFKDPRIKLEVLDRNSSMNVAVERCMQLACGKYVANISSDDMWAPTKLEKQVAFLESNPGIDAVFTQVEFIGEDGSTLDEAGNKYAHIFQYENREPAEWLRRFFFQGNCLCNPSVMIKREVYASLHYQDKRLATSSDFDLWVRFSFHHRLWILDEELTKFRIRDGDMNLSSDTPANRNRAAFEQKQILDHYLDIRDPKMLLDIFPESTKYGAPQAFAIPYFLGRLAIDYGPMYARLWGCEKIFALMADKEAAEELERQYDFRYADLLRLTKTARFFDLDTHPEYLELCKSNAELEQRIHQLEEEQAYHQKEISAIHATVSWRATKPLRTLRALFKHNR